MSTPTPNPIDPGPMPEHLVTDAQARDLQRQEQAKYEYELHPYSKRYFPLLDGIEFSNLVESIEQNGLIEAITLYEGMILDGRNRYLACKTARYQFREEDFVELSNDDDPLAFVWAKNRHRRHLSTEDKQAAIKKLLEDYPEASSRWIASLLRVSHHTVEGARQEAASDDGAPADEATGQPAQSRIGRDGKRRKTKSRARRDDDERKKKHGKVKAFIFEWGTFDVWQKNFFVKTYQNEIATILDEIDERSGQVPEEPDDDCDDDDAQQEP